MATFGDYVGVVPFIDDEHLLLVRQYRYVQREDFRWEIPTGGVHEGGTTEMLETAIFPFGEVVEMVLSGEIRDSMSVIGVLCAARLRGP